MKSFLLVCLIATVAGCRPLNYTPRPLFKDAETPAPPPPLPSVIVTLSQPTAGQVLSGIIAAIATPQVPVTQVEFFVDGIRRSNIELVAPFEFVWDTREVADGSHQLHVMATATDSSTGSSPIVIVTVKNAVVVVDRTAIFAWTAPTTNADGTPLADLAGYKLYQTLAPGNWGIGTPIGLVTSHQLANLSDGLWNFGLTAVDTEGRESAMSNVVTKRIGP